jgi:myo-inositol-1(or 4)-monophosphatase
LYIVDASDRIDETSEGNYVKSSENEYLKILLGLTASVRKVILQLSRDDAVRAVTRRKATDVTRKIDEVAEEEAVEYLQDKGLSAYLVSEESSPRVVGGEPEIAIVLDPLDGSMNFVNSIPFYAVSVAIGAFKQNMTIEDLTAGVVRDVVNGDVFSAVKGLGAYHNKKRIMLNQERPMTGPLLSFYSYGSKELPIQIGGLQELTRYRTLGSASLEICYVASGKLDAMIDVRGFMRIVDFAAGKIVLEEAEGIFTDIRGKRIDPRLEDQSGVSFIAARNEKLHEWLLKLMWG